MSVTIRPATEADGERVIEMALRFIGESAYARILQPNRQALEQLFGIVGQVGTVILAEVGDQVVGMIALAAVPNTISGEIFVEEIAWWIEPEHRSGILGPRLLVAAEKWTATNGHHLIKMVAPAGTDVGEFYLRRGYLPVETAYLKRL